MNIWTLVRPGLDRLGWDPPTPPIMVRVVSEEPSTGFDLADVLIKSLGLTAVITIVSLLLGVVLGGIFIWLRRLRARNDSDPAAPGMRVTPQS